MSGSISGKPARTLDLTKAAPFINHAPRMVLGEGGLYRPSDRTLHYLDIERKPASALFVAQLDAQGNLQGEPRMLEVKGSRHVTSLSFRKDHPKSYICTTHTGLAYLSEETGEVTHLPNDLGKFIPEDKLSQMRFNDAVCDSKGRFYFHSMSRDDSKREGKFYMYEKGMERIADLKVLETNFAIGNGPVIDEERNRLYFNSTTEGIGYVFDWDSSTGLISNRRVNFNNHARRPTSLTDPLTTMVGPGFPDGHTLDSQGRLYQAVFARGLIERFTPEGDCDLTILLGARAPTSVVFGGDNLRTLYVTTASEPLTPGEIAIGKDLGGCILKVEMDDILEEGVKGLVKPEFDG